jgi:hypothetical protein
MYWVHLEDDFLFHRKLNYITEAIRAIESLESSHNVKQCLFNRNYSETMRDWRIVGHIPQNDFLLHNHHNNGGNYSNCHYWPDYSFRPSVTKTAAILSLGNFDSPNTFFERDFANKFYAAGFRSAFFNDICCTHIGKLTSDKKGINAYVLNQVEQGTGNVPPKEFEQLLAQQKESAQKMTLAPIDLDSIENALVEPVSRSLIKHHVINLASRPDRKHHMLSTLKEANIIGAHFVQAVQPSSLRSDDPEIKKIFSSNYFCSRTTFIAAALSHYRLWQQLA